MNTLNKIYSFILKHWAVISVAILFATYVIVTEIEGIPSWVEVPFGVGVVVIVAVAAYLKWND